MKNNHSFKEIDIHRHWTLSLKFEICYTAAVVAAVVATAAAAPPALKIKRLNK